MRARLSDLDRLIRLEEFLKDGQKAEGTKIILEWTDSGKKGHGEGGEDDIDRRMHDGASEGWPAGSVSVSQAS